MSTENNGSNFSKLVLASCAVVAAIWIAAMPLASAQDVRADQNIEEIVVTAQRREQSVLETPVSISVITEDVMVRQNIDSFADYAVRVPGLTFDQVDVVGYRGETSVTIRGVQGRTNYYLDDTPMPVTDVRLFDVSRVEVLRGPQGTLYGDASMGGTIKVITNKPSTEGFSGRAATGYSLTDDGENAFSGEAYVNVPIGKRVAFRIAGYYEEVPGFVDNIPPTTGQGDQSGGGVVPFKVNVRKDVNGGERSGLRAVLRFEPADSLSIDLGVWLQTTDLGARGMYDDGTDLETAFRGTMFAKQTMDLYNATIDWKGQSLGLVSSTTYYTVDTINSEDITVFLAQGLFGFSPSVFTNPQQLNNSLPASGFSHETRMTYEGAIGNLPVFAVGGVFYKDGKTSRDQYWFDSQSILDINHAIDPTGSLGFDFGNNFDALGVPRGLWAYQTIPNEVKQLAFFGEFSLKPVSWLELTAGLRSFHYDIDQTRTTDGFLFQGFETQTGSTSDSGVNPRFIAKATVSENVMVYASAAKGFNIGSALGSALPDICQAALDELGLTDGPIKPESLWSYELGTKGRLVGGKLSFDTSIFYIDWKDIQEGVTFPDNSCPETLTGNFGNATIRGGELTFAYEPTEHLQIGGSFGYSDADRTQEAIGTSAAEQVGNTIMNTSIQMQYSFTISSELGGYVGGDYQWIEEGKEDVPGTPHYSLANLRVGLVGKGKWEAAIVGRNIFNSRPILTTYPPGSIGNLLTQDSTLRPRTIGFEASLRF